MPASLFIHSPQNKDWLRAKWDALVTLHATDRAAADATWDDLIRAYSEPHRTYHNLSHIIALLRHAEAERARIERPEVVKFAIWFHDVIYDTRSKTNEERSAQWARGAMEKMGIDHQLITMVEQCILATQQHQVNVANIPDLPLFLDIDLSILGTPSAIYRHYGQGIRSEYGWVPSADYRAGRSEILRQFIDRPTLFFTPLMNARYETQARDNLAWELKELSST